MAVDNSSNQKSDLFISFTIAFLFNCDIFISSRDKYVSLEELK